MIIFKIEQIEDIKSFGTYELNRINKMEFKIYDKPEFQAWKSELCSYLLLLPGNPIAMQVNDFINHTFKGFSDERNFSQLGGMLKALKGSLEAEEENEIKLAKEPKIFISHSSKDIKYINEFVVLLERLGVQKNNIFCSSISVYGIPGGLKIYDYLRDQFYKHDLHIIFFLSNNYYESAACLNEMGAAWVGKNNYTAILLPGFDYKDVRGVVENNTIHTKLDDSSTIRTRLNELKNELCQKFNINIDNEKWEEIRDDFIKKTNTANNQKEEIVSEVANSLLKKLNRSINPIIIRAIDIVGNVTITIGDEDVVSSLDSKLISKYDSAINELLRSGMLVLINSSNNKKIYEMTQKGYEFASKIINNN